MTSIPHFYKKRQSFLDPNYISGLTARCLVCDRSGHPSEKCPNIQKLKEYYPIAIPLCARVATPFPIPSQTPDSRQFDSNPIRRSSATEPAVDYDFPSLPIISPNNCLLNSALSTTRKDVPEVKWGHVSITPAAILPVADPSRSPPRAVQSSDFPKGLEFSSKPYETSLQSDKEKTHFEEALCNDLMGGSPDLETSPMWGRF